MQTTIFDYLIFIGRFSPPHKGHIKVINEALAQSKNVIVLIGSSNEARSLRNPFTWQERKDIILKSLDENVREFVIVMPLMDNTYNDQRWVQSIQETVQGVVTQKYNKLNINKPKIGLIGYSKDNSSYYLNIFPQWSNSSIKVSPEMNSNNQILSSSFIRNSLFENNDVSMFSSNLTKPCVDFLEEFKLTNEFKNLKSENDFILKYKKSWSNCPYPPIFVTVDAVVIQSGHILMVRRKAYPGKGMLALPGGFVRNDETLLDGVIRELREETKLKVPVPVLKGSIKFEKVFDNPFRSARGRTITTAFLIELSNSPEGLPKVKGSDDAKDAMWIPLSDINNSDIFEDHFHIINYLIDKL